jgi:hypothetical protein
MKCLFCSENLFENITLLNIPIFENFESCHFYQVVLNTFLKPRLAGDQETRFSFV